MTLTNDLNRLAGTTDLSAQGAANAWAGTTDLDLVDALNVKAGTTGLALQGVLNSLAGTTDLGVDGAAALLSGFESLLRNGNFTNAIDVDDPASAPPPTWDQWVPNWSDTTIVRDTSEYVSSPASLHVTGPDSIFSPSWNVVADREYRITLWFKSENVPASSWTFSALAFDDTSTGAFDSHSTAATTASLTFPGNVWTQFSLNFTPGLGHTKSALLVQAGAATSFWIDDIVVEEV